MALRVQLRFEPGLGFNSQLLKNYIWLNITRVMMQSVSNCVRTMSSFSFVLTIYSKKPVQGNTLISTYPLTILLVVLSGIRDLTEENSTVCHAGTSPWGFIKY